MSISSRHVHSTVIFGAAVLLLAAQTITLRAAPTNTTAAVKSQNSAVPPLFIEPPIPKSSFILPKKPSEGRDPFFPKSTWIYDRNQTVKPVVTPAPVADLTLKGISGTTQQPLAIINNVTFAAGEELDVMTKAGKMSIRCIEINMDAGTVLVQVGGERRQLRLAPSK